MPITNSSGSRAAAHRRPLAPLATHDFVYRYEAGLGQFYENGSYRILVGRDSYAVTFQGKTLGYGLRDFLSAVEACARHHEWAASRYTQRCQMVEEHGRLVSEQE